jgi:trans-AT polyketide synthase/acyltransferase/oxidoreductase domain-containing protein
MLEQMSPQDTDCAPSVELFEIGVKIRVLKRGVLFPSRANKLHDLYRHFDSLDELDMNIRKHIEDRFFGKNLDEVYEECCDYSDPPYDGTRGVTSPKQKMAVVFKCYLQRSLKSAIDGDSARKVDFQIPCSPAIGAFNLWFKSTTLAQWHNRHVDSIAESLMQGAAEFLSHRAQQILSQ